MKLGLELQLQWTYAITEINLKTEGLKKKEIKLGGVAQAFNPNTRESKTGGSLFEANLVYKANSRSARAVTEKACLREKQLPIKKEKKKSHLAC